MQWQYSPYQLPLFIAVAISSAIAFRAWQRRSIPGVVMFTVLMVAVAEWSLGYILELGSVEKVFKIFWVKVQYLGIVVVPLAWFAFAIEYTGKEKWFQRGYHYLLSIVPLITLILCWTNAFHGLIWRDIRLDDSGPFSFLQITYGVWFWVHSTYSYLLLFLGTLFLVRTLFRLPHLYRGQAVVLLLAALIPWFGNAIYISGLSPFPNLDLTSFAFTLTGIIIALGIFRYRLFNIIPVARDAVIESMRDAVLVFDVHNRIVDLNPAAEKMLGCITSEIVGQPAVHALSGRSDGSKEVVKALAEHSDDDAVAYEEVSFYEGEAKYSFELRISHLYDKRKRITGKLVIMHDITRQKQAQEALRKTLEKLRVMESIVNRGPVVLFLWRYEPGVWPVDLVSSNVERILGYTVEEFISGRVSWPDLIHPDEAQRLEEEVRQYLDKGAKEWSQEYRLYTKSGAVRWMKDWNKVIHDANGNISHIQAIVIDVTELKQVEEALRESEERFHRMADMSPFPVSIIDKNGRYEYINRKFVEVFGYTLEDVPCGKEWFSRAYPEPDYRKKVISTWLEDILLSRESEASIRTFNVTCKDRRVRDIIFRVGNMEDGRKFILYEDITERKQTEEQLRKAQKMEAIGSLAGGIAHDFNNLLAPIVGFADLLMLKTSKASKDYEYLNQIKASTERAASLTNQLLTISQRVKVKVSPINLNRVSQEVVGLLERTIDRAIVIETHWEESLETIEGDAGQLHQVLLNLCLNARDAMPDGGVLIIETENAKGKLPVALGLKAGQYVILTVTDTGSGMDTEVQKNLFDPFFTTKEKGRGLGLAMVYGIVQGHRGAVQVESEPGQGSTFRVYLPVVSHKVEEKESEDARIRGGSEMVLVVDDEEPVRTMLEQILKKEGYNVLLASDGVEATELYAEQSKSIDLVVLDIIMPRMGGSETFKRLKEINPEVKVLLSSGYSEEGHARNILTDGAIGFIHKPYTLQEVLRRVRDILDGKPV